MNKIPEIQLTPIQLKRLAAQRQLYSSAKRVQAVQIGFSTLTPLILASLVAFCSIAAVYAAIGGMLVTCLSIVWWIPWRQSLKTKAAKIQELFDCEVLDLEWRELTVGSRLEMETVEKYATKHRRKARDSSSLEKWYPEDVGKLPLWLGRIVCQRSNCWWDAQLRRRYAKCVVIGVLVVFLAVVFLGRIGGWTVEKIILAIVNPLMPTLVLGMRQYKEHTESAARLDKLREYSEGLWMKALRNATPEELTHDSRELQDEIYNHRRTSPLIFDWLYNCLRRKDEELMNRAAEELVNEALKSVRERKKRKF
jgi:hypothetical protein